MGIYIDSLTFIEFTNKKRLLGFFLKNRIFLFAASFGLWDASRGACLALIAMRERSLTEVAETTRYVGSPDVIVILVDVQRVDGCRKMVEETVNYFGRCKHLIFTSMLQVSTMRTATSSNLCLTLCFC